MADQIRQRLRDVWARALDLESVDDDANFFTLGGDSVGAVEVILAIQDVFGLSLDPGQFAELSTIRKLEEWIRHQFQESAPAGRESRPSEDEPRATLGQCHVWLSERTVSPPGAYDISLTIPLHGQIDKRALQQSLNALLVRQAALRTVFRERDGELFRESAAECAWPLDLVQESSPDLCWEEQAAVIRRHIDAMRCIRFDLSRAPLVRARLLTLEDRRHALILVLHHIACDGWSVRILVQELADAYRGFSEDPSYRMPRLIADYDDYVVHERRFLSSAQAVDQLRWWDERLAGVEELVFPPPATEEPERPRFGTVSTTFTEELTRRLRTFARARQTTVFTMLLATLQSVLLRHFNRNDILVVTPVNCRFARRWESLIGYCVNLLPVRTTLDDDPTFNEFFERVQETFCESMTRWETPFEQLGESSARGCESVRSSLTKLAFAFHEALPRDFVVDRVTFGKPRVDLYASRFSLEFHVWDEGETLRFEVFYDRHKIDDRTVGRISERFVRSLTAVIGNAELRVSQLPGLSHEIRQLGERGTRVWSGDRRGVHEIFDAQSRHAPERVAIVGERGVTTYAELNRSAQRLTRALSHFRLPCEASVGILIEPLDRFVEAILGVLGAGAAYLPLDASWPEDRLRWLVADSQCQLLIAEAHHRARLESLGVPLVILEPSGRNKSERVATPVPPAFQAVCPRTTMHDRRIAYTMYTSGSTGAAKGVSIEHGAVTSLVLSTDYVSLDASDVVAQVSDRSFDASTFEIWGALLNGATLVECHQQDLISPDLLAARLRRHGVTTLFLTTAVFHEMVRHNPNCFRGLRTLLFGGERADPRHVAEVIKQVPTLRLVHVYGPTETTTFATWQTILPGAPPGASVPIGGPIRGARVYVLDRWLHPVEAGVTGEIYVAGQGLARGYLGAPGKTAEGFLPDPFVQSPGARMYRTGDLAIRRQTGEIEFVGREDRQIKVRGRRIELGEIEAVLTSHPRVWQAVVALVASSADPGLVAWVDLDPSAEDGPVSLPAQRSLETELRQWLQQKLPGWMIPAHWYVQRNFPRTHAGKIDRLALIAQLAANQDPDREIHAPLESPDEETVARIFACLIGREVRDANDHFFDLGGHSLQATQVISRLRALLGVDLPIATVFRSPTPRLLAEEVQRVRREFGKGDLLPLRRLPRHDGVFPLSYAQQRLWFLDQLEPGSNAYNVPFGMRLLGPIDVPALQRALERLVERHESLRTSFTQRDDVPVQLVANRPACPLEQIDVSRFEGVRRESEAQRFAVELAERPFDLTRDCLLRARLLRLRDEEHVLVMSIHHIACDGWSLGVLARELPTLYASERLGREASLEELAVQYADFSVWQRGWLQGSRCQELLDWWSRQVAGLRVLRLPTDRPRTARPSWQGRVESRRIEGELTRAVHALCRQEKATLFMCLLAVFQTLLSRYTGEDDIAVGCPIANRRDRVLEGLIGFFVNSLVVRVDLSGDPTFRELLRRVRRVALDAYERQDLPFEKLVESIQPVRDLSHNPLFQITFAVQNAPLEASPMPGIEVRPFVFDVTAVRFDLEFDIREREQGLAIYAFYRTDLFDRSTVQNLLAHFENLLADFVRRPDQRLSEASMLGAVELQRLVIAPNQTQAALPEVGTLHGIFERRAEASPDRVAIQQGHGLLTYRQLNEQSDQLADSLIRNGIKPGVPVAIGATRSIPMAVATLAVLKAGAVCMPMDLQQPARRVAGLLSQAGCSIILVADEELPPLETRVSVVRVADLLVAPDRPRVVRPAVDPRQHAYLLFTSGSTGEPNGVFVSHLALANYLESFAGRIGVRCDDRILQFAAPSFDVIIEELFTAWHVGATVVLAAPDRIALPTELQSILIEEQVTALELPAAFWRLWVDHLIERGAQLPDCLRFVLVGCEQPDLPRLHWWQSQGVGLFTVFGLTETAVTTSVCELPVGDHVERLEMPLSLGPPLANCQYYVLDRHGSPLPAGVTGELYIGGQGLATGYLHRAGLTAERFVPDPFGRVGGRLYRTGDLARLRSDGLVEFLGRRDQQFNLRGFRIEAGEIENALRECSLVQDVVVALCHEEPDAGDPSAPDPQLVAYVVCRSDHEVVRHIEQRARQEHVAAWREFYDDTYREDDESKTDPTFDLAGWISTYTGEPLTADGMREQVEQAVERILAWRPSSILEIGCGTGLLLCRLAPHCERYLATDLSEEALHRARRNIEALNLPPGRVQWLHRAADDVRGLGGQLFDVVCLNSVIQHFPDTEYLIRVVENLSPLVAEGGMIFLGDIRLKSLAAAFYTSVELERARGDEHCTDLRRRIARRQASEPDLILDDAIFSLWRNGLSRLSEIRIEPKRGRDANELCRYRFDVTLVLGTAKAVPVAMSWHDWRSGSTREGLRQWLGTSYPAPVALRRIPNLRIARDLAATRLLDHLASGVTVGELQRRLEVTEPMDAIDPEDLWRVAAELGYVAHVRRSDAGSAFVDAAFLASEACGLQFKVPEFPRPGPPAEEFPEAHADRPGDQSPALRLSISEEVGRNLSSELARMLPRFMIPSNYILLDRLPKNSHGKVDRAALPKPDSARVTPGGFNRQPLRTETERRVARIWCEVLRQESVGSDQHFFELGGHSLLAAQLIARLRVEFSCELPLRLLFDKPVLRDLAASIDQTSQADSIPELQLIVRADRHRQLPLSYAQERLWFLQQLDPANRGYTMRMAWNLAGTLDVSALRRSLTELAQRHESLRTVFPVERGQASQQILAQPNWSLEVVDLSGATDPAGAAQQHVVDQENANFNLSSGPLVRCCLLKQDSSHHTLVITIHHIVSDGWSNGLFLNELATAYREFRLGRSPQFPALAIQYVDFAVWQRGWLQAERLEPAVAYWKQKLQGLEPLSLPCDRARSSVTTHQGAGIGRRLSVQLCQDLETLAQNHHATLFMTLFASFNVLLGRITGQTDIVIGTPVANRPFHECERVVGMFVNAVALRTDLSGDPEFSQLLSTVRGDVIDVFAHSDVPFERLVQELRPDRSLAHNPVFQIVFAVEPESTVPLSLEGVVVAALEVPTTVCRFDFEVHVLCQNQGLVLAAIFNRDLFDRATIEGWLESWETLLGAIVANPHLPVSRYPVVSQRQTHWLLAAGNCLADHSPQVRDDVGPRSLQPVPRRTEEVVSAALRSQRETHGDSPTRSLPELFAEQAQLHPQSLAVESPSHALTYQELDQYSDAIAQELLASGVRPDDRVTVHIDPSPYAIAAILGALKAGAAYVPFDPAWPALRCQALGRDVSPKVLLTTAGISPRELDLDWRIPRIDVDQLQPRRKGKQADLPRVHPNQLGYVIYTSGSTGQPKGVAVSHGNLVALFRSMAELCAPTERDVWSLVHSLAFDYSVWEMWGALLHGGRIIVAPEKVRQSSAELLTLLVERGVTILSLTPTGLAQLVSAPGFEEFSDRLAVRTLFLGGERLQEPAVRRWRQNLATARGKRTSDPARGGASTNAGEPGLNGATKGELASLQIINLYGVTEVTVASTAQRIDAGLLEKVGTGSPIGEPLAPCDALVLDHHWELVPPGVVGELYLGGDSLARGYWSRPGPTAERFVPHPLKVGERIYRTGDLVRWRANGSLELVGRADEQIKIRGHRLDPGEVAGLLREHPEVSDAHVTASRVEANETILVGYVVARRELEGNSYDLPVRLIRWLRERVPVWMVPRALVILGELPRLSSGKIDSGQLPVPEQMRTSEKPWVPPRTPAEQMVAEVWADVLGSARVGIYDDFFEAGGHSLLAAQLAARIRELFDVEFSVRTLFEEPNIAGISQYLRDRTGRRPPEPPLVRVNRASDLPLSFAQQRLWFLDRLNRGSGSYNVPLAMRIIGPLNRSALEGSLHFLIDRHESLRTTFVEGPQGPMQRILPQLTCPLTAINLTHLSPDLRQAQLRHFAQLEESFPFDLSAGPLIRATLFQCDAEEHVLLLTLHHIVCDGWSIGVLTGELGVCYESFRDGIAPNLPALEFQYADFADWQRRTLDEPTLRPSLRWWRTRLAGFRPARLPGGTSETRSLDKSGSVGRVVSGELRNRIKEFGKSHGLTLYMMLRAGLNVALGRLTGSNDVAIGTPVANRQRRELEGIVGFFVNTVIVRISHEDNPTFRELLLRTREATLEALAHQDVPFEQLVAELRPELPGDSESPIGVLLSVQNAPWPASEPASFLPDGLPGPFTARRTERGSAKAIEPIGLPIGTTRFDLELLAWEQADAMRIAAIYREGRAHRRVIDGLLDALLEALQRGLDEPAALVSSLLTEVVPAAQSEKGLPLLPETGRRARRARPSRLEEFVADWASRHPDKVAVQSGDRQLTYGELDHRAKKLAAYLRSVGVGPETPVGLCADRSPEMVLGIVAILKAGGAYVPLPPDLPASRLELMLEHASVRHVLVANKHGGKLPASGLSIFEFDALTSLPDGEGPTDASLPPAESSLAYILFTSGSTGSPKTVGARHQSVVRLLVGTDYVHFDQNDVVAQVAGFSFDGSTFEIWGALLHGATLQMIDRAESLSPAEMWRQLVDHQVTVAFLPTALFHELASAVPSMFRSLRYLIVGGERLDPDVVRRVLEDGPERLVNGYGPTETTTFATWFLVDQVAPQLKSIPIGRPILGTECYVLDHERNPVGQGERGELFIGGNGLSRGYLNDPALTAERFLPNPFSQRPGERMYRTGDLVRILPSGIIDFAGRVDDQVKIRGHRVELGEVESLVRSHPDVERAAVVVWEDGAGQRSLVGYVTRKPDGSPSGTLPVRLVNEESAGHIETWRQLYEDLYRQDTDHALDLNLAGWNSSYTGEPIPVEAMREQIEHTVRRIRRLAPRRVLEIGCGTGLLLFRLASECDKYTGTDFSPMAVDYVRQVLPQVMPAPDHVELLVRDAEDFSGLEPRSYDAVVLNSIVQYFPSVDYLRRVLERAMQMVRPGGHVFVGDVRNLQLLSRFHTDVVWTQAKPGELCEEIRERIRFEVNQESELLVDPNLFFSLRSRIAGIEDVRVELKGGVDWNELTRFRFDVTITLAGGEAESLAGHRVSRWFSWPDDISTGEQLARYFREGLHFSVGVRGVPDRRLLRAATVEHVLSDASSLEPMSRLRETVDQRSARMESIDPMELWDWANAAERAIEISPSRTAPGCFDVVVLPPQSAKEPGAWTRSAISADGPHDARSWEQLTSNPLRPVIAREFGDRLARHLRAVAPEHLVPATFVLLDRFPLNAHGKIERRALPPPPQRRSTPASSFVEPRTKTERLISAIWAELLRLDRVGAHDHFFELGGHSLLATQVVTRLRGEFRMEIPLRTLFESPTVAALASRIDEMNVPRDSGAIPSLAVPRRDGDLPLSFAQQRLWFLDQLEPGNCAYNMAAAIRLLGPLQASALHGSLQAIVMRHEALRTTFPIQDGKPIQRMADGADCRLPTLDLSRWPAEQRQREILRLASLEETTPFDLARGPLYRFRLLRCGPDEWVLLLTMHHIVSDGWSISVFVRELAEHYRALAAGRPLELPKLPIQYADFARWQREWLSGERLQHQLQYWREKLAGLEPLRLPTDFARPSSQTYRGSLITRRLAPSLRKSLESLGQREGATLFMTLLAAFDVLLSRCSGQTDVVVGTPIANRNRREIEGLIGFFVNSLILRTDLSDDPPFLDLLRRVRETSLEAFANQDLPFEKLVEELRPDRNLTRNPLFQVMFAVQNATRVEFSLPGLTLQPIEFETATTRFDLEVHVWDDEDGLTLRTFYNSDLFTQVTVERWLAHYETLLLGVLVDPQRRVSELPLLGPTELSDMVTAWNEVTPSPEESLSLTAWFRRVAARRANDISVSDDWRQLTYAELERRSAALAARLVAIGNAGSVLGPETLIGLVTGRRVEMIIGMLAILRVGGAYVPLEPDWPEERLVHLLTETRTRIILTDSEHRELSESIAERANAIVLVVEPDGEVPPTDFDEPPIHPDQLAYVMFTSGSTGAPKGVQVTHRNVVRLLQQADQIFEFEEQDRWSLFHSFAFDFSVWEIWGALCHGSRLEIPSYVMTRSPDDFFDWMVARGITVLNQTPTAFSQLLGLPRLWDEHSRFAALRYVIFGGESLDPQLLRRWFEQLGDQRPKMINMFGITETTVHATFGQLTRDHLRQPTSGSPIGSRLGDLQIYLLDERLNPVPQGVIGEIYVGGAGLARGYLNDRALTAERFVPHPWGHPGERLYRSGDLGRYFARGTLEHWGRCDQQVKLRGFRIEPREIEQCVRMHPKVRDVVVCLRPVRPEESWLVAYVTLSGPHSSLDDDLASELHRYLRRLLPEHMLPRAYVTLDELPRSANGKIKRDELPLPASLRPELSDQYVAPRTTFERQLAGIWEDVLRLDRVGVYDNFFELGGHSLMATQVVSRIRELLGVGLPLRALFESPNIAELAARMEESMVGSEPTKRAETSGMTKASPEIQQGEERAQRRRQAVDLSKKRRKEKPS